MPRKAPRPELPRCDADSISIWDCAKAGLLKPGTEATGHVPIYSGETASVRDWVPVLARIDALEGQLTLANPWLHEIRVEAKASQDKRGGTRLLWSFECRGTFYRRSCGRLVRKLYRRADDPYSGWACQTCQRIRFRDSHKEAASLERFLASPEFKRQAQAELERMFMEVNGHPFPNPMEEGCE